MINRHPHVKSVLSLRERKQKVEKSYTIGGTVGFWIPVWIFGIEVFYYVCRILSTDIFLVAEVMGETELDPRKFDLFFDIILIVAPGAFTILSYFAFAMRKRIIKYILLIFDILFFGICVVALINDFNSKMYIVGAIYSFFVFIVCVDCIKAYNDDLLLQKADGYPHFNPTVMQDEEPKVSKLRFRDKKSFDELYDERMEEYARENPDSVTGKAYKQRKEEEREEKIDSWLDEMFTKNGKNE